MSQQSPCSPQCRQVGEISRCCLAGKNILARASSHHAGALSLLSATSPAQESQCFEPPLLNALETAADETRSLLVIWWQQEII